MKAWFVYKSGACTSYQIGNCKRASSERTCVPALAIMIELKRAITSSKCLISSKPASYQHCTRPISWLLKNKKYTPGDFVVATILCTPRTGMLADVLRDNSMSFLRSKYLLGKERKVQCIQSAVVSSWKALNPTLFSNFILVLIVLAVFRFAELSISVDSV